MDYPRVILVSAALITSCRQTDRQTHRQNPRITDADEHLTHATVVSVTKY